MSKKILVVAGNPKQKSFSAEIARRYQKGAQSHGAEVRFLDISSMEFDPVLHGGYNVDQALEPDLQQAQDLVAWADHLVFAFPLWWGGMPAKLKGFFDRVFLPGFAFSYEKGKTFWKKLLTGRSGEVFITMDAPTWWNRWVDGAPVQKMIKRKILQFCGVNPVMVHDFGSVKGSSDRQRGKWLALVEKRGVKAAA